MNVDLAPSDSLAYLSDPDYALYSALPEPKANEIYALVRVTAAGEAINFAGIYIPKRVEGNPSFGTIDFGDGHSGEFTTVRDPSNTYSSAGDYVVKITYTPVEDITTSFYFSNIPVMQKKIYYIGMKVGSDVIYDDASGYVSAYGGNGAIRTQKYIQFNSDYWCSDRFYFNAYRLQRIEYTASKKFTTLNIGGNGKFQYCNTLDFSNLTELFSEITEVGNNAFVDCQRLNEFHFPKCTKIGMNAFSNCYQLKEANAPLCTEIGNGAFYYCTGLRSADFPNCVSVGNSAFSQCVSLIDIKLADSCIYGDNAFIGCNRLVPSPALT